MTVEVQAMICASTWLPQRQTTALRTRAAKAAGAATVDSIWLVTRLSLGPNGEDSGTAKPRDGREAPPTTAEGVETAGVDPI